jgi:hypothetical protein
MQAMKYATAPDSAVWKTVAARRKRRSNEPEAVPAPQHGDADHRKIPPRSEVNLGANRT